MDEASTKIEQSKTSKEENFPVGSKLIPPNLRKHVMYFYNFARTADDIADTDQLSSDEKLRRLDELEAVLLGNKEPNEDTNCAYLLKKSLEETKTTNQHALDLLKAFRADSIGTIYNNWMDLIAYCRNSAGSVGRYMLDLHKESPSTYWPSDALCAALQINNHLQDCADDLKTRNRIYIPKDWFKELNIDYEEMKKPSESKELRQVFDKVIAGIDGLLVDGSSLPLVMQSRGLRMEVCVIYRLAQKLSKRLKKNDILKKHVDLTKTDWLFSTIHGILDGVIRRKIKCVTKKQKMKKKSQN